MSSGPRKVFDGGRRRENQTGGEGRGGARSDGRFVPDKPVRARGTDGGVFCNALQYAQPRIRRTGFLLPGGGPSPLFSEVVEKKEAFPVVLFGACTKLDDAFANFVGF